MRCSAAWTRARPGAGDGVVAQALPERLVHQGGDLVGEAEQDGIAGEGGEPPVEAAVAVVPAGEVGLHLGPVHGVEEGLGLRVATAAARGERGHAGLQQQPRLEHVERPRVVRRLQLAEQLERVGGDERAGAGARLEHAADLQRADRLAHAGAADLEPPGELPLAGEPRAGGEPPGADLARDPVRDPLVPLRLAQR